MPVDTYQHALDWLYSFVRFDHRRRAPGTGDLSRMERLLERLGTPQIRFPSVLVAGTKGKGSTAAMLASILCASGYRTGLYTSPHLHTFRERIRVDETLITREEIIQGVQRLEALVPEFPDVIWFELVTALAFEFFARLKIQVAVLEVGLGGRLDPTNIVQPLVSVITPISYDHTEVLGSTLGAIAHEKAGIIKRHTPIVTGPQEPEARAVIEATAREKQAPLVSVERDWTAAVIQQNLEGQRFRVQGPEGPSREFFIPLLGHHQVANATTVLAVIQELGHQGWRISDGSIREGFANVKWPVRLELVSREPIILADGAHNRASAHALRDALDELFPRRLVHFIFGASSDKDIAGMFEELLSQSCHLRKESAGVRAGILILTHSHHVRATAPEILTRLSEPYHVETIRTPDLASALTLACARAAPDDVICATGSLFVAAEARALLRAGQGRPVESDDV